MSRVRIRPVTEDFPLSFEENEGDGNPPEKKIKPQSEEYINEDEPVDPGDISIQSDADIIDEDDLALFPTGKDSQSESDIDTTSVSGFPSQCLVNNQDSIADKQNLHTEVRGVTPTQFGELVCSIRHGLSKHALQDLTTLINRRMDWLWSTQESKPTTSSLIATVL